VSSSPSVKPSYPDYSTPEQLIRCSHRLHQPPNFYSPSAFTVTTLSELASYHDVILHPEWQNTMVEEITSLERSDTWILCLVPHVSV
jgi:hypothetical protein